MTSPALGTTNLRLALIDAYRGEIKKRYELRALRQTAELDNISEDKLVALRDFFLDYIYPPSKEREALDMASDRVGAIFRSPRQLMPMMGLAMGTLWRLGAMIPSAAKVTATTLESLKETRLLEERMLHYVLEHNLKPGDFSKSKVLAPIIASIPGSEMDRFRNDVLALFRSMNSSALLRAGVEIMTKAIELMGKRPDTYDEKDVEGFTLGRSLIEGSLHLYERLQPSDAQAIVNGIERIEIEWYEKMKRLAKGR